MLDTLFYIPHEVAGLPLFGWGWGLIVWALFSVGLLAWLVRRQGWNDDTRSYLPLIAMLALAFYFLPALESVDPETGQKLGLPIRGFGTCLMVGIVLSVILAGYQSRRMGFDPEKIYSLAFWVICFGIAGARLFYIVQYWPQFQGATLLATVWNVVKFTEGGIVIYGGWIGGWAAGLWIVQRRQLPALAISDLVAPSIALGMAIGRIGCFCHGCCFGGLSDYSPPLAVTFPHNSPPYIHQFERGLLHGIQLGKHPETQRAIVRAVDPAGPAAKNGLQPGDEIKSINGIAVESFAAALFDPRSTGKVTTIETTDGRSIRWSADHWPPVRSKPVHPVQIYSAIQSGLLCLLLWSFYPFRRCDGQVVALFLTLYPIGRFLEEIIRVDEPGRFGTSWSISQWISVAVLAVALALWVYLRKQPTGSVLPPRMETHSAG